MASLVQEIMSSEVHGVRLGDPAKRALDDLHGFEMAALPVLDSADRPIGIVSSRALAAANGSAIARDCMQVPAPSVAASARILEAARLLAGTRSTHLTVLGEGGRAVGSVSAAQVLAGLLGLPAPTRNVSLDNASSKDSSKDKEQP